MTQSKQPSLHQQLNGPPSNHAGQSDIQAAPLADREQASSKKSRKQKDEDKSVSIKPKSKSQRPSQRQMSQIQWQAEYENEDYLIKSNRNKQVGESAKQSEKQMNPVKKDSLTNQMLWEAAYIDNKYYLSDPQSLRKLKELQTEIEQEKLKLAQIETAERFDNSYLSERCATDEHNNKQQCLTEINESRLLVRKQLAEDDLLKLEAQYQEKILQIKKKKSILKKQIGCGTNDKKMQVDQLEIERDQLELNQKRLDKSACVKNEDPKKSIAKPMHSEVVPEIKNSNSRTNKEVSERRSGTKLDNKVSEIQKKNIEIRSQMKPKSIEKVVSQTKNRSQKEQSKQKEGIQSEHKVLNQGDANSQKKSHKQIQDHQLNLPELTASRKAHKIGSGQDNISPKRSEKKLSSKKADEPDSNIEKIDADQQDQPEQSRKTSNVSKSYKINIKQQTTHRQAQVPSQQQPSSVSGKQPSQKQPRQKQPSQKQPSPLQASQKQQSQKQSSQKQSSIKQSSKKQPSQLQRSQKQKSQKHQSQKQPSQKYQSQKQQSKKSSSLKAVENQKEQKQVSKGSQKKAENRDSNLALGFKDSAQPFKKVDKSVQWEETSQKQPTISKFEVQKSVQCSNLQIPKTQKSKKQDQSRSIHNQSEAQSSVNQRSYQPAQSQQSAQQKQHQQSIHSKGNSIGQKQDPVQQKEMIHSIKDKSVKIDLDQNAAISVENNLQQRYQQKHPVINMNQSKEQSKLNLTQKEANESERVSEFKKNSISERSIPSEKKKTVFKIHSRENRSNSKHSRSSVDNQKRHPEISQSQSHQNRAMNNSKVDSGNSNSEVMMNQFQIKYLQQQVSDLQEKLKKVEEKQEQIIKFENNQSKVMSELEASHAGSGSEPASPLGKFNLTSRLKLQAKLSLEGETVHFNSHDERLKKTAEDNQKLEKIHLQQEIGRLKKVIRDMQMEKIMSIEHDQSDSKIQLRKPSILEGPENNTSRISEKWKDSLNSDMLETKKNQWNSETVNNETGKIKKNSPLKYHIDSPRKYNKLNAERSKQFSELAKEEEKEQNPLPSRKKAESVHNGKSREQKKQEMINKFQQNERNFQQFLEASRLMVQQPQSYVEPANQSVPEAYETKNQAHLLPSVLNSSPPDYKKTVTRNFSEILEKLKHENPEDDIAEPQQISIRNIDLPHLPEVPNINMTQDDLVELARKTYKLFGVNVDEDQNQLCMKKYKNCVVFMFGGNQQQTILWHYSGKFYIGGWKNSAEPGEGEKIGEGLQYIPGKHLYKGQFLAGKKNGNGIVKMSNGNVYDGQWVDGSKNGRGVYFEASTGTYYSGEWKQGKRDGYGILKFSNHQFYEGTFSKSIKHGYGIQKFANGDYYKGEYEKGKFNGKGKYCWSNGSSYQGDFVEGSRHGQGSWKSARKNGDIYIGGYENDKKCGYGRYVWSNNCVYEGYFQGDLKNGKGRLVYQDGKQIKGTWQDGNLISPDQEAKKHQNHEEEPLRRSIRASSLRNAIANNSSGSSPTRKPVYL